MRVSTLYMRALVEGVRLAGGDPDRLAASSELGAYTRDSQLGWVDLADFDRASAAALALVGRDDFGVLWGSSLFQQFDLGRAAAYAPTLRAALALIDQFQARLADAPEITFVEQGDAMVFTVHPFAIDPTCRRVRCDFVVLAMMRLFRHFGAEDRVLHVWFDHPRPRYPYAPALSAPLGFGVDATRIAIGRSALDLPSVMANPELEGVLRQAAGALLPEPERATGYAARVRALLELDVPRDSVRMGELARQLGTSERTLRRALAREGVSFQDLVQRVRIARARELLAMSRLSVKEVAAAVGFNSPTAFQRAFKRETGFSPSEVLRT